MVDVEEVLVERANCSLLHCYAAAGGQERKTVLIACTLKEQAHQSFHIENQAFRLDNILN